MTPKNKLNLILPPGSVDAAPPSTPSAPLSAHSESLIAE